MENDTESAPQWVDPPPPTYNRRHKYVELLSPLIEAPGKWAKISEHSSESAAYQAARHLTQRKYTIPNPTDNWEFTHRENAVYAVYHS